MKKIFVIGSMVVLACAVFLVGGYIQPAHGAQGGLAAGVEYIRNLFSGIGQKVSQILSSEKQAQLGSQENANTQNEIRQRTKLTIEEMENGSFDVVIQNATIIAIPDSHSFEVAIFGVSSHIVLSDTTRIVNRWWGQINSGDLTIGNTVNIWGSYTGQADAIGAYTVRIVQ